MERRGLFRIWCQTLVELRFSPTREPWKSTLSYPQLDRFAWWVTQFQASASKWIQTPSVFQTTCQDVAVPGSCSEVETVCTFWGPLYGRCPAQRYTKPPTVVTPGHFRGCSVLVFGSPAKSLWMDTSRYKLASQTPYNIYPDWGWTTLSTAFLPLFIPLPACP